MPLKHPGIIEQAQLLDHEREATICDDALKALDDAGYKPTANALTPSDARMRRAILSWIAPGMQAAPLRVLMAILEMEVRGRGEDAHRKNLETLLNLANVPLEYGRARQWVRYKLGLRPLERTCLLLPKHDRTKTYQPYQTGFTPSRAVFSPAGLGCQNWWDPWNGEQGIPVLCSALRINDETVLILEARATVTRQDRMRLICELSGVCTAPPSSVLFRFLPGRRQIIASDVAYVRNKAMDNLTKLTVRPHITEPQHVLWNLAEMTLAQTEDSGAHDLLKLYGLFSTAPLSRLLAVPGEYQIDKVFILLRPPGSSSVPIDKKCDQELPGRLKDNIVSVGGAHPDLDGVLASINFWPLAQSVFLDESDECYVRCANHIAEQCKVDPLAAPSVMSRVTNALLDGEGLNIWLPGSTAANWLRDGEFRHAMQCPGRTANIFVCVVGRSSNIRLQELQSFAASGVPQRAIHCQFCYRRLDRVIVMFEDGRISEELEPGQVGRESLLDVLARLFGTAVGGKATA